MQTLVNILVILDSIILGLGIYFVVTAKTVGESREKKSVTGKNPVKAAFEFEIQERPKAKRQAKKASTPRKENHKTTNTRSR